MADTRTKNATRNIASGFFNKFVSLVLPFVTRTLILYLLGASYLGIGTLFASILGFLSLTELGLGAAIVYSMYKPIAENDTDKICVLLNFYKKMYRIIGLVVLGIGTVILPFVPYLMKGEAPDGINIYILYYIYLINSVISYFFFGYKQSLLTAHQRSDITSNIHTISGLIVQFGQIFALYFTKNFYVYAFVPIVGTMLNNITVAIITSKKYPHIVGKGSLDTDSKNEILKKISGLFGTKVNAMVVHASNVIFISSFLGLTMAGLYGNYHYIMNAVCGFVMMFFSSLTAGIGNKLVVDSIEENYRLFKRLSFINAWIVGWGSVAFFCLYEPFMKIWVGEEMQLGLLFTANMTFYFYIYEIQRTIFAFKDALGLWQKDRLRPYVSMIINIVANFILVPLIGVHGVVISSSLSFLLTFPWLNSILFKNLFVDVKPYKNILSITRYFIVTLIACAITHFACCFLPQTIIFFVVRILIVIVVPNIVFVAFFFKDKEFNYFTNFVKRILRIKNS